MRLINYQQLALPLLVLFALHCQKQTPVKAPAIADAPDTSSEETRVQAEQRWTARQDLACERVAAPITQCALESAKQKAPDMYEELTKVAHIHTDQVLTKCKNNPLSVRQIVVYETCPTDAGCAPMISCLSEAKKETKSKDAASPDGDNVSSDVQTTVP